MKAGHGGVTIGSEISGGARDVFVEQCEMSSPDLERGLRIKTNAMRGGVVENVFVRDVTIGEVGNAIDIDMLYEEGAAGTLPPDGAERPRRADDGGEGGVRPLPPGARRRADPRPRR